MDRDTKAESILAAGPLHPHDAYDALTTLIREGGFDPERAHDEADDILLRVMLWLDMQIDRYQPSAEVLAIINAWYDVPKWHA